MGLFSKKYCDICEGNMGIVTDNKCSDGKFCHDCAKKLSPWFRNAKNSTLDQIKEQIADREENKKAVEAFNVTRVVGKGMKVVLDEASQKFMVTGASNYRDANPDVMNFTDVKGVNIDIHENQDEIFGKNSKGEQASFNPPHYRYNYQFNIEIDVDTKYFTKIRFELGNVTIEAQRIKGPRPGMPAIEKKISPLTNFEYKQLNTQATEIKNALTKIQKDVRAKAIEAAKPKKPVKCPCCGATTLPDANGCCEYCGSAI